MGACGLLIVVGFSIVGAQEPAPLDAGAIERVESVRKLLTVRLDPKLGSQPGECERLAPGDVAVAAGGVPVRVTAVERVPAPERHWLLVDVSSSAEGVRREAKRSASRYVREILTSTRHRAALLTVDDDTLLVDGPTADGSRLLDRVEAIAPGAGHSLLIDGLEDVLRQVEGDRREHLIVYWTDGQDSGSFTSGPEILDRIARTPSATIVPLAITIGGGGPAQPPSPWLFDIAERSGGEVFASHDPAWLDRIRGWLDRRFVVSVAPGNEARGKWAVRLRSKRCEAVLVHDAIDASSRPVASGPPRSWIRSIERSKRAVAGSECGVRGWERPWIGAGGRLTGCVLDLLSDRGTLYTPFGAAGTALVAPVAIGPRSVAVDVPPFETLPDSPEALIERLIGLLEREDGDGAPRRSKYLIDGRTLFTQQASLARALYAAYPAYRSFATQRLGRVAKDEIDALAEGLRSDLGGLDADTSIRMARAGRMGQSLIAATRTPTDADLRRVLAAWLGDVPASEIFRLWERRLVAARLAGDERDPLPRWRRARSIFALPTSSRILAPLVPVRDRERDLVGFYRVVLPRASGILHREGTPRGVDAVPYDLVPERPYGLWVLETLDATHTDLVERLASLKCTLDDLAYEPIDVWKQSTEHPWHAMRVRLDFACSPGPIAPDGFLSLAAEIEVDRDETARIVRGTDVGLLLGKEP